ncbi:DUF998 domain-containing protein [Aquisalinus flavus]|uniref:DUF998 domain-containing protein n=1 Tax=Aquisalinus flavus TaxID=1526572 RepID=A0A8J2V6R9_9PROT|nr:DUF998 domain-containing protein [Aquisalinus flavus]MBD0426334.1 DUF998 domain-containing protein [Aquisalinus flavus]GGD08808.1 hypothetical protein GCM10011342_17030 [Aquisalinus flavus]
MRHLAFWAAILTGLVWLIMLIAGGLTWPGYSHVSQYISELGAIGAPQAFAVNWFGFLPIGILMIVFCLAAIASLPKTAGTILGFAGLLLWAGGYIISPFFPCDYGCPVDGDQTAAQVIHNLGAVVSYLAGAVGLIMLGGAARQWPGKTGGLATFALAAGIVCLACFLFLAPHPFVGLVQRLGELVTFGWMIACGAYLVRQMKNP